MHWSLTTEDRKTSWLVPIFYDKYREILTHTAFRFGLCCPIDCCMPDHIHMLWLGVLAECDQRVAMRYFRKPLNPVLEKMNAKLQLQPYGIVKPKNWGDMPSRSVGMLAQTGGHIPKIKT